MARYNQPQQPYSPPPYQRHPYPPPPYGHQHYAQQQQHYPQAPYPPHPQYAHPHPAYPPSDPNQYPQYHDGYPPQKKHKGNPVVTRYPPPNNYQSPPPPPQPGYPAPHQHYPPQPAYSPPAQAIPPPPPPGWVPPPPPGWRGPVPPPPPPQPSYYPPTYPQPQPQPQHQPYYPPQPPYVPEEPVSTQQARSQHNQASHWNASHGQGRPGQRRFTSLQWKRSDQKDTKDTKPSVTPKTTPKKADSATPGLSTTDADSNGPPSQASPGSHSAKGTSVPPKTLPVKYDESEDFDFDNYYADEDEDVDKSLSLGTIVWLPGQQVKRAIPALYSEMHTQPPEPLSPSNEADHGGVSIYTTAVNEEEQSQPIKASREWNEIKDDPIFARLVDDGNTIPIEQVIANRDRPPLTPEHMDADEEEGEIRKERNILEDARISLYSKPPTSTVNGYGGDLPMEEDNSDDDDDEPYSPPPAPEKPPASDLKIVENTDEPMVDAPQLETQDSEVKHETNGEDPSSVSIKVKTETVPDAAPLPLASVKKEQSQDAQLLQNFSSKSSASASPATPNLKGNGDGSHKPSSLSRTPEFVRDQSQEEILARLGVTGEPVPLSKAPAIVRNQSQEDILAKLGVTGDPKPTLGTPGLPHNPQEDILARLGVTGEPKPTRGTPGPAHNPIARPPPREELRRASSSSENVKSAYTPAISPIPPPPPPPPPPAEDPPPTVEELDPWTSAFDVSRASPKSQTSQHTQVGSDFHEEPEEVPKETEDDSTVVLEEAPVAKERTPTPPNIGKNSLRSRKRTRTNSEEVDDGVRRQKDDVTPRLRRRQPKVASAYGRRW